MYRISRLRRLFVLTHSHKRAAKTLGLVGVETIARIVATEMNAFLSPSSFRYECFSQPRSKIASTLLLQYNLILFNTRGKTVSIFNFLNRNFVNKVL